MDTVSQPGLASSSPDGKKLSGRRPLPGRREQVVVPVTHEPIECTISVGYLCGEVRACEVFGDGIKGGSHFEALLDDICILISLALQHGLTPEQLQHHLSRHSDESDASAIGAIVRAIGADEAVRSAEYYAPSAPAASEMVPA